MKRKISLLIFLIIIGYLYPLANNHTYRPMVEEGKEWTLYTTSALGPNYLKESRYIQKYKLDGQVMIDSINYIKCWFKAYHPLLESEPKDWSPTKLLYRQEDSKVYYYGLSTQDETLIYDFGLNLNDSIFDSWYSHRNYYVLAVDTAIIFGNIHKCLTVSEDHMFYINTFTDKWISGIGSYSFGCLPSKVVSFGGKTKLIECKNINELLYYANPESAVTNDLVWKILNNGVTDTYRLKLCYELEYFNKTYYRLEKYDSISNNWQHIDRRYDSMGKILRFSDNPALASLIFDENAELGDTLDINGKQAVIDSVYYKRHHDILRKHYRVKCDNKYDTWIDGIGSVKQGILGLSFDNDNNSRLIECSLYDVALYQADTTANDHPYRPMVEEGKEWHYTYKIGFMWNTITYPNRNVVFKMQGDTIIDNKSYKKVYSYTDYNPIPDCNTPFGFIREDCENRIIYGRDNNSYDYKAQIRLLHFHHDGDYIIFDMLNPRNNSFDCEDPVAITKTFEGTEYYGLEWKGYPGGAYFEGLGYISEEPADLFGIVMLTSGNQGYLPYIYRIKDGSGKTLYYNSEVNGVNEVTITSNTLVIEKNGDFLRFTDNDTNSGSIHYDIINMQGVSILKGELNTAAEVNISNLQQGIYIVRAHTPHSTAQIKFIR